VETGVRLRPAPQLAFGAVYRSVLSDDIQS